MATISLPTSALKDQQVSKAQRHYDSLKNRHDNAKQIVDEIAPDLQKAQEYLEYLKKMPVVDGPTEPAAEPDQPAEREPAFDGQDDQVFA